MSEFVVVGSLNVDLVTVTVKGLPKPGETILGASKGVYFGGKGANQAVACARLGGKVSMIGAVGDDEDGSRIMKALDNERVKRQGVRIIGKQSGFASVTVSGSEGENTVIVVPGANALLSKDDVDSKILSSAKVVSCQNEISLNVTRRAFQIARRQTPRAITLWNPAPPPEGNFDEILAITDILCVNESEAIALSQASSIPDAIEELSKRVESVIVTIGNKGVLYRTKSMQSHTHIPAFDAGKAMDTTGAGDCFCGSLGMFLCAGLTLDRAIRLANQVAAVSVTRPGAQASYPTLNECPSEIRAFRSQSNL